MTKHWIRKDAHGQKHFHFGVDKAGRIPVATSCHIKVSRMPRCVNVLVLLLGTESAFARSCEHPLAAAECANALQYRHSGDAHGLSFPTDRSGAWGADQPRRMGRPRMSFEQSPEGQGVAKLFEDHDRRVLLNLGAYLCEF